MGIAGAGRAWDEAASSGAARLARSFESAWEAAPGAPPDPVAFLPDDPGERPGALLALLRAEMSLRRRAGESFGVERHLLRHPDLDREALLALIYEEFCLREEAGEPAGPGEFEARFPDLADSIRVLLDIHGLVAERPTATAPYLGDPRTVFPEVGQTIAGFHLVEELGRGSFARVFRAEERQLADRPVVLKVAQLGTREPQTLARLQHTHIVPVHSYRTDPATGLHLLCMPYFGRLTLSRVLASLDVAATPTGADLVAALDRLHPAAEAPATSEREALGRRTYARAIAWWGERLAEALRHAHDRGVLHRDIKPSNVLVTDDGLPMLLDFNLSQGPRADEGPERLGGTLAYMAPEHLEALVGRPGRRVDHRSDLYSLGLLLREALGVPPMPEAADAANRGALLFRLIDERRSGLAPAGHPRRPIPPAFEAVLRKCLAPDPSDRYASAADLAADLRAVADATPLRFAREPLASRAWGWARRNRLRLAAIVPLLVATAGVVATLARARDEGLRRESMILGFMDRGDFSRAANDTTAAAANYAAAAELADGWPGLRALGRRADDARRLALGAGAIRDRVDGLSRAADRLRFHLLGFGGDRATASRDLMAVLAPFGVLADPGWSRRPGLGLLDPGRRDRLIREVDDLLFLWVVTAGADRPGDPETGLRAAHLCDRALEFTPERGPWEALRDRSLRPPGRGEASAAIPRDAGRERSARACFRWALLAGLGGDRDLAIRWLARAQSLGPGDYWSRYALAYGLEQSGDVDAALRHYEAAIALKPDAPWALYNRSHLYAFRRGAWGLALEDLDRAVASPEAPDADRARFRVERGKVRQAVGDVAGARADFEAAIAHDPDGPIGRAGRLDRARLDAEAGATRRARAAYDALLDAGPADRTARLARARLAIREARPDDAEADLDILLGDEARASASARSEWRECRALARLGRGRPADAADDAEAAFRLRPGPAPARLLARARLAAGREVDPLLLHPDEIVGWPAGGAALAADLRAEVERRRRAAGPGTGAGHHLALAAMLAALGDHAAATAEADRAVALEPSPRARALRAEVRIRAGDRPGAALDVGRGLATAPDDPALLTLQGRLAVESGAAAEGIAWLARASFHGAGGPADAWRARALAATGRDEEAASAWSAALARDPDDPVASLGRARAMARLGLWENALADLERAAERAAEGSPLFVRAVLDYAACLPARPDRLPRAAGLARRAVLARLPGVDRPHAPPSPPGA